MIYKWECSCFFWKENPSIKLLLLMILFLVFHFFSKCCLPFALIKCIFVDCIIKCSYKGIEFICLITIVNFTIKFHCCKKSWKPPSILRNNKNWQNLIYLYLMMIIKKLKIINAHFKMTIGVVLQKHKHFLEKNFRNVTY